MAAFAKVVGFVADQVDAAVAAEPGVALRSGRHLLVAGDDEVRGGGADAVE